MTHDEALNTLRARWQRSQAANRAHISVIGTALRNVTEAFGPVTVLALDVPVDEEEAA